MNSNKLEMVKFESLRINVLWTTTRKSVNFPVTHLSKAKKVKDYLICEPFISLTTYACERLIFHLFIISDGFLEKTLRFLDLMSSIGVGGSRSVLGRTLFTTFYTMIIIFDIMSWSFLTAFLWFSDWSHTAAQKPSSEQGMVWLKVTSRCDRGRNWAVAHPTATGSKWLTFCFATMIQRNEVHTPPGVG